MKRFIALTVSLFTLAACATQQSGQPPLNERAITTTLATSMATTTAYGVCADLFVANAPAVSGKQIPPLCESDGEDVVYYASGYSIADNRSIWSAYVLDKELVQAILNNADDHRSSTFRQNPTLKKAKITQPSHNDYTNSGYNRGHYAPSKALAWDSEAQRATFMVTNIAPQDGPMNQNLWRCFEVTIRDWALANDMVKVVVGSVGNNGVIGKKVQITVPTHYFAMIYREKPRPMAFAVLVPNRGGYLDIRQHVRSVAQMEGEIGIRFGLTAAVANERPDFREWPVRNPVREQYIKDDKAHCVAP